MDRDLESARRRLAILAAAVGHEPDDEPDAADLLAARRRLAKLTAAVSEQGTNGNG